MPPPYKPVRYELIMHFSLSAGSMPSGRVSIENVYDSDAKLNGVVYSIRNADVFDSGTYECKVENKFMGIAKRVTIDVLQVSE